MTALQPASVSKRDAKSPGPGKSGSSVAWATSTSRRHRTPRGAHATWTPFSRTATLSAPVAHPEAMDTPQSRAASAASGWRSRSDSRRHFRQGYVSCAPRRKSRAVNRCGHTGPDLLRPCPSASSRPGRRPDPVHVLITHVCVRDGGDAPSVSIHNEEAPVDVFGYVPLHLCSS